MGLDRNGHLIGYGFGPRRGFVVDASVCPGSRFVAELVAGPGPNSIVKRRLSDLRIVGRRLVPRGPLELHCRDDVAGDTFLFQWDADPARITRVYDGEVTTFFRGWTEDVTYTADHAYVAADQDHELLELDLDTGTRRRVGVRTRGYSGPWEASPDGSALATVEYFLEDYRRPSRLVVVDGIAGPTPSVRSVPLKPEAVGQAFWIDPTRVMYLPAGEPRRVMRLYDRQLNQLADYRPSHVEPLGMIDGELIALGRRGLVRFDFARGRPEQIGRLPRDVAGPILPVPGSPATRPGRRTPAIGKAHLARRACQGASALNASPAR